MGRPAGWMKELTGRSAMKSPGKPSHRREVERWFWREIAKGLSSEDAAAAVGVSSAAGVRWFRERGGMATLLRDPVSCRYLCFAEREEIALLRAEGKGVREIAREIGRSPSTISRELRRNAATRGGKLEYRASVAQWKAELVARRPKTAKLAADERLREYVQDRLAGKVRRPDGTAVAGPAVKAWKGRNKPRRQDRRWATAWSPEQISARLRIDFPDDPSMRISHEAIYQSLFVQGRGALARELTACLRTGRALRVPRARVGARGKGFISEEVMISQRPAEAADRAVPGHWEGDLIIGTGRSAIGTLVERSSRFTMLLHLPPLPGRDGPRVKNGPAVTGAGAEAVRDAIAAQLGGLPEHLRRSLTWDQGAELAQHARLKIDLGLQVYFCDPQSPWQRGTNENTNGLLRQYFPKGTDLARHSPDDLAAGGRSGRRRPRRGRRRCGARGRCPSGKYWRSSGDELERRDGVGLQPVLAREPAHAAAERVAGDADVGRGAVQPGEAVGRQARGDAVPLDAGADAHAAGARIDADLLQAADVDEEQVVHVAQRRLVVGRRLRRDAQPEALARARRRRRPRGRRTGTRPRRAAGRRAG